MKGQRGENIVHVITSGGREMGIHVRVVQELCKSGRIEGASRLGREWMIPEDAEKPADMRYKANKESKHE